MTPTPEMEAMAERIVEATRIDGPLGLGPPDAYSAALTAVMETSKKAANKANEMHAFPVYSAIRNGEHLK